VPLDLLRDEMKGAMIQQYGKPEDRSVLIRLPRQAQETDLAGQAVEALNKRLNPESAAKHDLNYLGSDRLAQLFLQSDPDRKGTNAAAQQSYKSLADAIIDKRSELGIFTSMQQVTSVPGVTPGTATVLNEKAFLGRFNLLGQETVGPQVGSELQRKAILAIVFATLAMGVYIAVRFDLKFGVAAVICMIYDVLVALSLLVIFNLEFSIITVASLLMVVGYSVNDKVVLYDRVRENQRKLRGREAFESVLNLSINQTLSRTVLTGGSVMLVLVALILFGGEVLSDFAWLLLVGTIAGTYSSLTLAPLVVLGWDNMTHKRRGEADNGQRARLEPVTETRKRKAS
jgi:preprotein translocase subunit SecF